jgi:hypothetical protein
MEIEEEEDVQKQVARVPHYKKPYVYEGMTIGYPFDLQVALSLFGKEIIPDTIGIYHLFYQGNLVYIGMSKNLRSRLLYHLKDREKVFDGVLWFKTGDRFLERVLRIEAKMIKKFVPSLNTACIFGGY